MRKIFIGTGGNIPNGFDPLSITDSNNTVNLNHLKSGIMSDSADEIIIENILEICSIEEVSDLIDAISNILVKSGNFEIHFIDAVNLFRKFDNRKISLEEFNSIISKSKSLIDKSSLTDILNKSNFDITGFQFKDSTSWDDYNCIIKAKNNKSASAPEPIESQKKLNMPIIDNLDFTNPKISNDDSEYDFDLLNEVINTDKHPDSLDYDLLSEVMNFSFEPKNNEMSDDADDLLTEVIGFSPVEIADTSQNEGQSLFEEIMNFSFDEDKPELNIISKSRNSDNPNNLFETKLKSKIEDTFSRYEKETSMKKPSINIVWEGSQFVYNPLAHVNREMCSVLLDAEVANLTIVPYESDDPNFNKYDVKKGLLENDIRQKKEVSPEIAKLPYAWIRHQFPPKSDAPRGSKWFIMQPWEFSRLRSDMKVTLSLADEIWAPSFYTRKAMIDSGLDFNKVQVVPLGINPDIFKPYGDKYHLNTNKKFKFLYVGGTIYRKGFDILLKAFIETFNGNDDVCLVIKEHGADSFYKGMTSESAINSAKREYNAPEILYINDNLTELEMASLYRACNVIAAPYRGESFCLPLLEGTACGLPAIATKGGASDDFLEEAFTYFISAEKNNIGNQIDGMPLTGNATLLEPSFDELKEILLSVYNNPGNLLSMGTVASAYARTKWTWDKSIIKALRRLDYHFSTKMSLAAENQFSDKIDDTIVFGTAEHTYIEGDFNEAVELYMKAIKGIVPEKYKLLGLHRIAMILINKGEYSAVEDVFRSIDQISFNHPDTIYLKVILNASQDKHTEALEFISELMDNWTSNKFESSLGHNLDDLLVLTADLLRAGDDIEAAHSLYTTALSMNNSNAFACYGAGMCFKVSGLENEAKEMFRWAVDINPEFEEAKFELENM
ncbi:MAG: glycosyltransferase [Ignavibacteriae bacterium]|nr:glycosyltransferase [Ignavibacteriota bacterium]